MRKDMMHAEGTGPEQTTAAGHWLYANMPDHHTELQREVGRLQRTIAALIAIGSVTECKARQAYDIAEW